MEGQRGKRDSINSQDEETCGCGVDRGWRCSSLQKFATVNWALLFLCVATLLHESLIGGLYGVSISTIQRRFELRSTESGIIAICYDIAMCFSLLFIPYYGGKGSKPLWIGWGCLLMGVGSITVALPHFIAPFYAPMKGLELQNTCGNMTTDSLCGDHTIRNYRFVFMFGIALAGIGGTSLATLAFTYMDENVERKDSPLYSGIFLATGSIGPGLGYFIGGPLLGIYTYVNQSVEMEHEHPLWIGAWWIGFIIVGVLLIAVSVPLSLLPKKLSTRPETPEVRQVKSRVVKSEKDIILSLGKNWTYILITMGTAVNFAFLYGANTFAAKYLESMFNVTPAQAALCFGVSTIIGAAFAMALSGAIISKFNLTQLGMIRYMVACAIVSAFCSLGFLIKCPDEGTHTFQVDYHDLSTHVESCSFMCNCTTEIYTPVCGSDHVTYFSPCFAGCTVKVNHTHYEDCGCIEGNTQSAVLGKCAPREKCYMLWPFMVSLFFCFFTSILTVPPSVQVTMRSVDFDSRSVALGLQRVLCIIFGIIPGRILTGKLIDLTCTVWGTHCDEKGSCRSYSRSDMSLLLTVCAVVETGLCAVFYGVAWMVHKPAVPSPSSITSANSSEENYDLLRKDNNSNEKDAVKQSTAV